MGYCSTADLQARLGHAAVEIIGDRDADGAAQEATLAAAVADVDALIDAHLVLRWPQCQGQASDVLRMIAVDLVLARLARGLARTEEITLAGERAERRLADIADGRIAPCPGAADPTTGGSCVGGAFAAAGPRVMTRQTLTGVL